MVDNHFLIVTRAFEPQEDWLNLQDFEALAKCLGEVNGLGFFNGGRVAGSSQPHKHLQVVPLTDGKTPVDSVLAEPCLKPMLSIAKDSRLGYTYGVSPSFPFRHAVARWDSMPDAKQMLNDYHRLLNAVGITSDNWQGTQDAPYNLLCTRRWMMLVPRSQEKYANISVNSLGFAGSLLVKDWPTLEKLKEIDPMQLLRIVGYSTE